MCINFLVAFFIAHVLYFQLNVVYFQTICKVLVLFTKNKFELGMFNHFHLPYSINNFKDIRKNI
jgi:hypothetical protein